MKGWKFWESSLLNHYKLRAIGALSALRQQTDAKVASFLTPVDVAYILKED